MLLLIEFLVGWSSYEAISRATQQQHSGSVRLLDQFATQLCAAVDVDLMPGDKDPVNTLFPQQAFHPSLLPVSSELSSLHRVTNPYECSVDGVVLLGTDGLNVNDQQKYTDPASDSAPIDTMVDMLETSHISPTAPDTIQSYPFPDRDPFVLVRCSLTLSPSHSARFSQQATLSIGHSEVQASDGF